MVEGEGNLSLPDGWCYKGMHMVSHPGLFCLPHPPFSHSSPSSPSVKHSVHIYIDIGFAFRQTQSVHGSAQIRQTSMISWSPVSRPQRASPGTDGLADYTALLMCFQTGYCWVKYSWSTWCLNKVCTIAVEANCLKEGTVPIISSLYRVTKEWRLWSSSEIKVEWLDGTKLAATVWLFRD
jgi:hypothetical protein